MKRILSMIKPGYCYQLLTDPEDIPRIPRLINLFLKDPDKTVTWVDLSRHASNLRINNRVTLLQPPKEDAFEIAKELTKASDLVIVGSLALYDTLPDPQSLVAESNMNNSTLLFISEARTYQGKEYIPFFRALAPWLDATFVLKGLGHD